MVNRATIPRKQLGSVARLAAIAALFVGVFLAVAVFYFGFGNSENGVPNTDYVYDEIATDDSTDQGMVTDVITGYHDELGTWVLTITYDAGVIDIIPLSTDNTTDLVELRSNDTFDFGAVDDNNPAEATVVDTADSDDTVETFVLRDAFVPGNDTNIGGGTRTISSATSTNNGTYVVARSSQAQGYGPAENVRTADSGIANRELRV